MGKKRNNEVFKVKLKKITLRNTILSFFLYIVPVLGSYLAIYLNLTSCPYYKINYLFLTMGASVLIFYLVIYFIKDLSGFSGKIIGLLQFLNWLILSSIWLSLLEEVRILIMLSAFIIFIFLFSFAKFFYSIAIVITFQSMYIATVYYCIYFLGQSGSFKNELFKSYAFFYSSLFLLAMVRTFKNQKKKMKIANKDADIAQQQLKKINRNLSATNNSTKKLVENLLKLSKRIYEESANIAESSDILSKGASIQVNSIKRVKENMDNIEGETKLSNKSASDVNNMIIKAKNYSKDGVSQMKIVGNAITDIIDSGESISKIIKTIDAIAFQTNILALNASVEAARVGKHGKGFTVVAQEIRNLAARSAEAASITSEIIKKSTQKVDAGTSLSEEASEALLDINKKISVISDLINDISLSGKEQGDDISNINNAMINIAKISSKNALNAKQTNEASIKLAETAEKIQNLLKSLPIVVS